MVGGELTESQPKMDQCRHIRVFGMVQGVNFRYLARQRARSLNIRGWVRNCPDGSVEAMAAGGGEAVNDFVSWMRRGPSSARVDHVEVEDCSPAQEREGFAIR